MTTTGTTSAKAQKVVPLVSSESAGPLGVIHLPRLWAKLMLGASGLLPEGYDECGPGFDQMTLNALNLDREKTMKYVRDKRPTYLQFERWIVEQNGGRIDPQRIRQHNEAVKGYNHAGELASQMRESCGLVDEMVSDAVTLNKLEDLDELHRQITRA